MMLRHPEKVTGFFGLNTVAPWAKFGFSSLRNIWRLWYQVPIAARYRSPVIRDPDSRFLKSWHRGSAAGSQFPRTGPPVRRVHATARPRRGRVAVVSQLSDQ